MGLPAHTLYAPLKKKVHLQTAIVAYLQRSERLKNVFI